MGTALVTGASAGIGAAYAERLAHEGYDVVVVARRSGRLEQLAARLRADFGVRAEALVADLADPAALGVVERNIPTYEVEFLVNNAGFGTAVPFTEADPELTEALIRVQVVAPVRLTRAAVPGMLARGSGTIINVSSIAAFSTEPPPWHTTYAATKAYLNMFTRGLRAEVRGRGIRVQAVAPSFVRTEILEAMGAGRAFPATAISAGELVDASFAALELDEGTCIPTLADTGLLGDLDERHDALVDAATTPAVAERYRR